VLSIEDPKLPGLTELTDERLCEITGADSVVLLRLRYRAGKRAIVHLKTYAGAEQSEGVLWFFAGDKARSLAKRNKSARFDPHTRALYERFPNDHRMPQIRRFLDGYADIAPRLIGGQPDGKPHLLRYRPGLSCTFRCALKGQADSYVKLINDDHPEQLYAVNREMCRLLEQSSVSIAPAIGVDAALMAVAYKAAPGVALDMALRDTSDLEALHQTIDALRYFWQLPLAPQRQMTAPVLLQRAIEGAAFVALTAPACNASVDSIVARLTKHNPQLHLVPVHADIKLEHIFLNKDHTTLIYTESVSIGSPDYDLAQLYGRLWQAEMEEQLPRALVKTATGIVRQSAGQSFDWCLDVVALRLAKFYAQRPAVDMVIKINGILRRLQS